MKRTNLDLKIFFRFFGVGNGFLSSMHFLLEF